MTCRVCGVTEGDFLEPGLCFACAAVHAFGMEEEDNPLAAPETQAAKNELVAVFAGQGMVLINGRVGK